MANYSLILDTKFKPFSYQEMLAPVAASTQAHQALEEEYNELAAKANVWDKMANEQTDSKAYKMYKTYADDLSARADDLMRYGLNVSSRKGMLDMRARYSKEIVPIDVAYKRREDLAKEQRDAMKVDPTLRYQRYAREMSLDDFIDDPSLDYGKSYSGDLLAKQVSQVAANYAKVLTREGGLESLGLPYQYKSRIGYGATPEEILAVINDAALKGHEGAIKFLKGARDQVLQSSGVLDWTDPDSETRKFFVSSANRGLSSALGQTELKNYTDSYSMQDALRKKAAQDETDSQNRINKGNIPIDIHHLSSPHQEGVKGADIAKQLQGRLGLSGALNGRYAVNINLANLKIGQNDLFASGFENKTGGTTVRLFNSKHQLYSKRAVMLQGKNEADRKALGKWYDKTLSLLKTNLTPDKEGHWTVANISKQLKNIYQGNGAITMGAMKVNFGEEENKKVLSTLLPELTSGDETSIYEITEFSRDGKITRGSKAKESDFKDDKGNIISTPMYYASPIANTDGLIMKFKGKTYLIPREKLGSLGEHTYQISIPDLQKAKQTKDNLIARYGEPAYYNSKEGQMVEEMLDNYGAAYLRAVGTTLGHSLKVPSYTLSGNDNQGI
mgnify:CR=1 FL=1